MINNTIIRIRSVLFMVFMLGLGLVGGTRIPSTSPWHIMMVFALGLVVGVMVYLPNVTSHGPRSRLVFEVCEAVAFGAIIGVLIELIMRSTGGQFGLRGALSTALGVLFGFVVVTIISLYRARES